MKHILAMLLALLGASGALAQIYVKVVPEKKTFLSGEAMYMRLTITNNSGVPVELKSRVLLLNILLLFAFPVL